LLLSVLESDIKSKIIIIPKNKKNIILSSSSNFILTHIVKFVKGKNDFDIRLPLTKIEKCSILNGAYPNKVPKEE
jgi:hypothetical protein